MNVTQKMAIGLMLLASICSCRQTSERDQKGLAATGSSNPADGSAAVNADRAQHANDFWRGKGCVPDAAAGQRVGKATITAKGDGIDLTEEVPALCGGLHQQASKRFAIGDGTLFRACATDGSLLQISSDVQLRGRVNPQFAYENYKRTGPLIELFRPSVGAYNQRDVIDEKDTLVIDDDWKTVDLNITLNWPAKKRGELDRLVAVTARFDCGIDMQRPSR
jgi:hypothetical protein